ncbi:MAG: hypothetical protein K0R90_1492 [Oscillospiraceae bacterium]|jgi:hypothetical protein|nr:hypothetical protein [Oscillospiraceae bacterium]
MRTKSEARMGWKGTVLLIFFFLAGVIAGTVIGYACKPIPFLEWLSWGQQIGIGYPTPVMLDLAVIKLSFGFSVNITLAQIICVILSLVVYKKFNRGF